MTHCGTDPGANLSKLKPAGRKLKEGTNATPDLVVRDNEGKPYSVRYEQINAMLLNEFLKAHFLRRPSSQSRRNESRP